MHTHSSLSPPAASHLPAQVLALLRNVPIRYPDAYNNYLKLNNQATAYPGDIVTMDCSLPYYAAGGLPRSMLKV